MLLQALGIRVKRKRNEVFEVNGQACLRKADLVIVLDEHLIPHGRAVAYPEGFQAPVLNVSDRELKHPRALIRRIKREIGRSRNLPTLQLVA